MKKYVDFLKTFRDITKEKLSEDYVLRSAIERNLQLAFESMLDIGEIIISMIHAFRFAWPVDYLCYSPEEFSEIRSSSIIVQEALQHGIESTA